MEDEGFLRLVWCDVSGIRRCRAVLLKRIKQISENGVGLAAVCMFLPSFGDCPPDDQATGPSGEVRLVPDLAISQTSPWRRNDAMTLATFKTESGDDWNLCPRNALASALKLLKTETDLELMVGFEVEFNLLKRNNGSPGLPPPIDTSVYCQTSAFDIAADVLRDMCSELTEMGQDVEQVHGESAPGQFEIVTRYAGAAAAADQLIFRKEAICSVAAKHGLIASFLPKLYIDQAGNGCHCHFSLMGTMCASPTFDMTDAERPYSLSSVGESFIAGILAHLPAVMVFTAGNPNSYRRLQPSTWSGAYCFWGVSNKEAPLRLLGLPGDPSSINVELKTVDGTANPHIALTAIVAAGLLGIRKSLQLPDPIQVDPANLSDEERAEAGCMLLPRTLHEALSCLEGDEEFGTMFDEIVGDSSLKRAYVAVKKSEANFFENKTFEEEVATLYERF